MVPNSTATRFDRTLDVSFGASSRLMNKKWSGVFGGNPGNSWIFEAELG